MRPWWLNTTKLPFQLAEMLCLIVQPQRYDDCFVFFISIDEWFIRGKIGRFPLEMGWNLCSTSPFLIFSSKLLCFESICFKLNGFVSTWNVLFQLLKVLMLILFWNWCVFETLFMLRIVNYGLSAYKATKTESLYFRYKTFFSPENWFSRTNWLNEI